MPWPNLEGWLSAHGLRLSRQKSSVRDRALLNLRLIPPSHQPTMTMTHTLYPQPGYPFLLGLEIESRRRASAYAATNLAGAAPAGFRHAPEAERGSTPSAGSPTPPPTYHRSEPRQSRSEANGGGLRSEHDGWLHHSTATRRRASRLRVTERGGRLRALELPDAFGGAPQPIRLGTGGSRRRAIDLRARRLPNRRRSPGAGAGDVGIRRLGVCRLLTSVLKLAPVICLGGAPAACCHRSISVVARSCAARLLAEPSERAERRSRTEDAGARRTARAPGRAARCPGVPISLLAVRK